MKKFKQRNNLLLKLGKGNNLNKKLLKLDAKNKENGKKSLMKKVKIIKKW